MSDPSQYWSTPAPGTDGQPGTPLAAPGARRSPVPAIIVVVLALAIPAAVLLAFLAGHVTYKTSATTSHTVRTIGLPPITVAPSPVSTTVGLGAEQKWRSLGVSLSCAPYGAWRGTARIRNEGAAKRTATFSWTLRRGDVVVATLHAAAHDVPAHSIAVTQVVAAERCAPGPVRAAFHVTATF